MSQSKEPDLADMLTSIAKAGDSDTISFGDVLDTFGQRVFGPMLMVPAFIAVAPTGAIPGMSLLTGAIIALVALQLLFLQHRPWLPSKLTSASISQERLQKTLESAAPYVERVDAVLKPRWTWLVKPPFQQVLAAVCVVMALSMFPLALLPFAVAVPGSAVLLMGIGLTTQDGYFAVAGLLLAIATLTLPPAWALGWLA